MAEETDEAKNLAKRFRIPTPAGLKPDDPVLVIDDQVDLRMIVVHQLQKLQFGKPQQASNGYEAIQLMRENQTRYKAFVVAMDMPVMSGIDFVTELRESPDLMRAPICLTMANVSKEKIMLAIENGVDEILVKPFTLGDIGPKNRMAFKKFHNPANPERVYELAKHFIRKGDWEKAKKVYEELAKASPNAARPNVGLARVAIAEQNYEVAEAQLENAESKNENYVHLYVVRANLAMDQEDWELAITNYKKAIELSPLNAVRYQQVAEALFQVKRYQEAHDLLAIALKHELNFTDLYHYLSQAAYALKDYEKSAKYIKHALQVDEENPKYLNQLGISLKEMQKFDEAQKVYNKIIKLDPENLAALYNKAVLMNQKGDVDDAIKILERILNKKPDFKPAATKLAEYKAQKGAA